MTGSDEVNDILDPKPEENLELSKETLQDLDASEGAGEVVGGARPVCSDRGSGCLYD